MLTCQRQNCTQCPLQLSPCRNAALLLNKNTSCLTRASISLVWYCVAIRLNPQVLAEAKWTLTKYALNDFANAFALGGTGGTPPHKGTQRLPLLLASEMNA